MACLPQLVDSSDTDVHKNRNFHSKLQLAVISLCFSYGFLTYNEDSPSLSGTGA